MAKLYRCGKRQIASENKEENIETMVENKSLWNEALSYTEDQSLLNNWRFC